MNLQPERFPLRMQNEGYVQEVEGVLEDIREYLRHSIQDSLHDADYEGAAADAEVLAAVLKVEVFVLSETPLFR